MRSKNYRQKGFTLAEVLVTLAVIGIVAAMTIPSLTKSYSEKEIVTTLKKSYSMLSQATIAINSDCSGNLLNCLTDPNAADNNFTARREVIDLYSGKLNVAKDCGNAGGCFSDDVYKFLNGNNWGNPGSSGFHSIQLTNGTAIGVDWGFSTAKFNLMVDCNGKKSPNQIGRDLFFFVYNHNNNMLEPVGINWSVGTCDNISEQGQACAERVLREGGISY